MLGIILYFFTWFLGAAVLTHLIRVVSDPRLREPARRRPFNLAVFAALLACSLIPYAIVEIRTTVHKKELRPPAVAAMKEICGEDQQTLCLKILSISQNRADVYIVSVRKSPRPKCASGLIYTLINRKGRWEFDSDYSAVWSDCASASGNIFPPYLAENDYSY